MSDIGWNSVEIRKEERPRVTAHELRQMMADLDPSDYDEPVLEFLHELEHGGSPEDLQRAATLLLQDEVDFAPELQAAGVEPDAQLIMLLLAVGADPNAANAYGEPPLHLAARYGYTEIVQMLLQAGANLRLPDSRGKLAADLACSPELAALLTPPQPDYLPPEIEDADAEPGQGCSCGHHHEPGQGCSCGHHHEPGQGCSCGHHHEPGQGCSCGHHHEPDQP